MQEIFKEYHALKKTAARLAGDIKKHVNTVAKCHIFAGFSEKEVELVLAFLKPKIRKYKKGAYIVMAGEPVTDIFFLLQGGVQIIREDILGVRSLLAQYGPGDCFLEAFASINTLKSPFSCRVSMDSLIMVVDFKKAMDIPLSPALLRLRILRNILTATAHKAVSTYAQIEHISRQNLRNKILSYLTGQSNKAGRNEFTIPMSKTDLADFLFVNRSAMTRELAAMKRDKIISFKGRRFTIQTE